MTWRRYIFRDFLVHVVPAELADHLLADLAARGDPALQDLRGHRIANPATITTWALDIGGMAKLGAPLEHFAWAGLDLAVPSDQVSIITNIVTAMPVRRFAGGPDYIKLKLWRHATVMTPEQRVELSLLLAHRLAEAQERAAAFEATLGGVTN